MLDGKVRRRLGHAIPLDPTRIGKPRHRKKELTPSGAKKSMDPSGKRTPERNHSTAVHSPKGEGATGEAFGHGVTSSSSSDPPRWRGERDGKEGGKRLAFGGDLHRRRLIGGVLET